MGNPRLLRNDDRVEGATITSSSEVTGWPDDNITDWKDYTRWKGSSANSHWLKADAGAGVTADCFAVAGHNLNTQGVTRISLDGSNNDADWTEVVADFAPPNGDDTFAKFFTQATWRYWRLDIDNNVGANYDPQIGIFYVGNKIEMSRLIRPPHDPDELRDHSNVQIGGAGHLLGLTNDYTQRRHRYMHPNIGQTFIDNTWNPFIKSYRTSPFVWVWDYENHSDEAYLMAFERPEHTMPFGGGIWRELNFQMVGLAVGV
jgi:hypothetical protein